MRIKSIFSLGKSYLLLGLFVAIVFTALFVIGYFVIYRKMMHGRKTLKKTNIIWSVVCICYLVVLIMATLGDRGIFYMNGKIVPLFASYREAWNQFDAPLWRNLIFNIFLFVPFGFLLPVGIKKLQSFWKTSLCGLLCSIGIELVQLISGRGIFECDDVLNNLLGTMIGYGIFELVTWKTKTKKNKKSIRVLLFHQIPLLFTCLAFLGMYVGYEKKEFGNLNYGQQIEMNRDSLKVETEQTYSEKEKILPIYQVRQASVKETERFAQKFFENLGDELDKKENDIYDETAVYKSKGDYSLWVNYTGMTYEFQDFKMMFPENEEEIEKEEYAEEETIRQVLKAYLVDVPQEAVFTNRGDGQYTFEINPTEILENNKEKDAIEQVISRGSLLCEYYKNGTLGTIVNSFVLVDYKKEKEILSEQEAYQMICDGKGKFEYYDGNTSSIQMKLGDVSIEYQIDTKGFYQPVYVFDAEINGTKTGVLVPALK